MGLLREFRSSLENPQTPLSYPAEWLLDIFNGGRTDSGVRVSEMTALQVIDVFACVSLISGTIGFLDLNVYERLTIGDRAGKRVAFEHDIYDLLENEPNPEMSGFDLRKTLQAHALLWGNLYAEIQRDKGNRPVALWPRNPARIRPYRLSQSMAINGELVPAGGLVYKTTEGMETLSLNPESPPNDGEISERAILKEDVIHIKGLALDGRVGQSVINLARQGVGLALATEKFGAKFFGNGARPYGLLQHPGALKKPALENLKRSLQEALGGENVLRPFVLEEGMTWKETSTKPNESQFLETRQFQRSQTCALFLVPPFMIGDTEKMNRANTEEIGIQFVTYTMSPWFKAWKNEATRKLFPRTGRSANKFFVQFDPRPLVMPDAESRRNFYASGRQWSYLCPNDILEMEHRNPIDAPWANGYIQPINMQNAETAFGEPAQGPGEADPAETPPKSGSDSADKPAKRYVRAYFRLFRDAFGRVTARSSSDSEAFNRAFRPVLETIGEEIYRLAAEEFGCDGESGLGESRFLADYIESMRVRIPEWKAANGDADRVAESELSRAIKALWIEVYRAAGTQRAKQLVEA